jgi:hypothetical protein
VGGILAPARERAATETQVRVDAVAAGFERAAVILAAAVGTEPRERRV